MPTCPECGYPNGTHRLSCKSRVSASAAAPTAEVVPLAPHIAHRDGDSRKWSAVDALRQALDFAEKNPLVENVYIAFDVIGADGSMSFNCAGLTHLEAIGLLSSHVHERCNE